MHSAPHAPVLVSEIIHALNPRDGGRYIDCTVGAGGHAAAILQAGSPGAHLLGLDLDNAALAIARAGLHGFGTRVVLRHASYSDLYRIMREIGWDVADGIVLDLGVSSMQLDMRERGFSFQYDAPLDMRFDNTSGSTAAELLVSMTETELEETLRQYGEEPRARRIAQLIQKCAPVTTTKQLADIVKGAYPERSRVHPATRTFQALRIAVNDELQTLQTTLPVAIQALRSGGRLAVISFHSLEDRMVKRFMRIESTDELNGPHERLFEMERHARIRRINRKAIIPSAAEIAANPRARSAKLRVAEKLQGVS